MIAPALWNGFPLLQWDTGGYLARWFEGYLVPSRPGAYGLVLAAGAWGDFWPVLIAQAVLTVWVLHLVLRVHGYGRPWILLGLVTTLCALTTLPWLSAILLTDILCGLGVLALNCPMQAEARAATSMTTEYYASTSLMTRPLTKVRR